MTLEAWVRSQGGFAKVSQKLGITRQAVWRWAKGTTHPKPPMITRIIKLSGGKLSIFDFYPSLKK